MHPVGGVTSTLYMRYTHFPTLSI